MEGGKSMPIIKLARRGVFRDKIEVAEFLLLCNLLVVSANAISVFSGTAQWMIGITVGGVSLAWYLYWVILASEAPDLTVVTRTGEYDCREAWSNGGVIV